MANRQPSSAPRRTTPRLYLVAPPSADPAGLADAVAQALQGADAAAVLVSLTGDDERALLNGLKALASSVQSAGAALVLEGRADLVARAGADGAHLVGVDDLSAAVPTLKPDRIAGCGGLATRHDAMLAAEAGADYVMFGEPDENGHRPSFDAVIERIEWWAEVFQIPCVGFAAHPDEIAGLVTAGADFVAVGAFVFDDPRGPAAAMKDAQALLSIPESVE